MINKTLLVAIALAAASADVSDTCTPCTTAANTKATGATTISDKALLSTYTCSAAVTGLDLVATSTSLKCDDGFFYTAASGAVAATCTQCTNADAKAGSNADTWTCKDTKDGKLKVTSCASGYYLVAGTGTNADECKSCTSVTNTDATTIAGSSGDLTCTSADTGINFATGAGCNNGFFTTAKPAATVGTGATCTACTAAEAKADAANNAVKWTCKDTKDGKLKVTECKSGFVLVAGSGTAADVCTACTSATGTTATTIANSAAGATFTCASGTNTGIDFATSSLVKCNAGYFYTAASAATGATCSQCMDSAATPAALVAPDGIKAGVLWTCDKKTGGRVVIPSTGCWSGYKSGITQAQSSASVASVSVAVLLVVAAWGL